MCANIHVYPKFKLNWALNFIWQNLDFIQDGDAAHFPACLVAGSGHEPFCGSKHFKKSQ